MPDERLITEIENILSEIIRLGGENERTQIVPNLTVIDANPTNLSGFIVVSDNRDGDNIIAKKLGGIVYTNGDLVNVLFVEGAEAVAFQQGSGSTNSGIWEIVSGTSTDIYYDKGNVGISNATPAQPLDITGKVLSSDSVNADSFAFIVKNSSGAVAAANEIGYIDEAGEYQTTTTQFLDAAWCVVLIGGADNSDIYVATRGRVTIELDGNCSVGDKLYTSTTAGQANPQSYMRPEMFAIALTANAGGAGGTCEALLHTQTRYVPKSSTTNIFRINNHSDTEFSTTINGAPTATTVVYTTPLSTGAEDAIVPVTPTLTQQRLWNTTRSTYRLISSVNTGTNTITTVSSTDSWANTDVITIESQTSTPSGAPGVYVELDFENAGSDFISLSRAVSFETFKEDSGAAGELSAFHPFLSVSASRQQSNNNHGTGTGGRGFRLVIMPLLQQVFCYKSGGSGSGTAQDILRLSGYFVAVP